MKDTSGLEQHLADDETVLAALGAEKVALEQKIGRLKEKYDALKEESAALEARNAELERRLGSNKP